MKRKTVPLHFYKSRIPLITFRITGDERYYAILDSGSEITMLGEHLKDKLKTKEIECETNLVGVNGGSGYKNLVQGACKARLDGGEEEVPVILGGMIHDMNALSSHFKAEDGEYIRIDAIIGGEFLEHYNAKIDYKKRTVTIDSKDSDKRRKTSSSKQVTLAPEK